MHILILFAIFCFMSPAWSDIQFEEVSEQAGITRIGESWGNAWGDFDGDGYLDLWATNHKQKPSLYRNNGDGTFTDIINEVWDANPHADTHGVAWADFDNDGDQDLIVLSGGGGGTNRMNEKHKNHFYVNENGMLREQADRYGISLPLLRGRTPLWVDWNRDGKLDLLVTGRVRPDATGALVTTSILEQRLHSFANVNRILGFQVTKAISFAQMADVTGDGNMEIFLDGNPYPEGIYDMSAVPFKELSAGFNLPKLLYDVKDAALADFNGDLLTDMFLVRGVTRNYIDTTDTHKIRAYVQVNTGERGFSFKTDGKVQFEIYSIWATHLRHLSIGEEGAQLTAFDGKFIPTDPLRNVASFIFALSPDNPKVAGLMKRQGDKLWGMYVGYTPSSKRWTILYETNPNIKTNWTGFEALIESNSPIVDVEPINFSNYDLSYHPRSVLLINKKNRFTPKVSFLETLKGRSVVAGDFDNDMDIDIYVVRSSSISNFPNHCYENQGDGTFVQLAGAAGAEASAQGRGESVTMADYDRDGYLDLFVTNGRGGYPFNLGPDQLFRNIGSGNNWLQIDLEGTVSNRDGIGARLFATTPDGKTQLRENSGGIHYSQQDQKRIHFGLGKNEKVSELVIHWTSGIIQKLKDIPANQLIRVVETANFTHAGDVNQDGHVNILDIVWIIQAVENEQAAAAPALINLSEADIAHLYSLYQKVEEMADDTIPIKIVKRFLANLLMPGASPLETKLHANYPNPFNPETWIPYQLATDAEISIRIYHPSGRLVKTVFTGQRVSGYYLTRSESAYWDGRNEVGERVASGVYIYELTTPTFKQTRRLVVLK